jgi:hypothetical protein
MKNNIRKILLLFYFAIWFQIAISKPVDKITAERTAYNFLKNRTVSEVFKGELKLTLVHTFSSREEQINAANEPLNYFYIFNTNQSGFIAVSAEDVVLPILAYSDEGTFDPNTMHISIQKWFQGYADQIRYAIVNKLEATEEINTQWADLLAGEQALTRRGSVSPLISVKWNQSPHYNDLCPYDNVNKDRTVTGCVATAMAQVLKYWKYPSTGTGFHSYNHSIFGTLSSSFGSHTYNYGNMPNYVTTTNTDVAQLMYDCGISVDMNYNIASKGGSGAYVISSMSPLTHCTEYALKTYFGFPSTLSGKQRQGNTDANWLSLLKTDLDAGQPVIYAGFGGGGGHCFVADGYDNNNYIHFNWGWGGSSDGYFQINALNPGSLGSGGGTGGFNSGHQAIFGVRPPSSSLKYNLTLNTSMTISPSSISYGGAFSVSANFTNNSSTTFSGDYGAAVFDDSDNFIDFIEIKTGYTLQSGYKYSNDLVFSTTGMLKMLPGKYWVGIFYRPTGGNWSIVNGTFIYSNYKSMTVTNSNPIALYSDMVVSGDPWFTKGQSGSVSVNIINNGTTTFKGKYSVNLYNLDGTYAQNIGTLTESNGLPAGYVYQNPLSFTVDTIKVSPGTYLLATVHISDGSSSWELTGTGSYQNPIFVDVVAPPIAADIYEVNDNASVAYGLSMSFSGNNANVSTPGSNCHAGSDYDFYKINLPTGFNYTVSPRLHDEGNTANGKTYTLDALFSYSLDGGSTWSDAFDDVMPNSINVAGGKTIILKVAPYFTGQTGTYLLEMPVSRTSTLSAKGNGTQAINIYPNPTKDYLYIDGNGISMYEISVSDVQGRLAKKYSAEGNHHALPVNSLQTGIYFVTIKSDKGIITQKIIKE